MKSYRFTLDYVVFSPRITIFDPYYIKELLSSQYTLKETTRKLQFAIWEELMPEGLIMVKPSNWKRIHRVHQSLYFYASISRFIKYCVRLPFGHLDHDI